MPAGALARHENVVARVMRETPFQGRGTSRTGHNFVDIRRIEAGIDVRTTVSSNDLHRFMFWLTFLQIMLRNIPNRVTQAQLKEILDQSSFGEFDFMYLRIGKSFQPSVSFTIANILLDFANNCNVGYAFINFIDVSSSIWYIFLSLTTFSLLLSFRSHVPELVNAGMSSHPLILAMFSSTDHQQEHLPIRESRRDLLRHHPRS